MSDLTERIALLMEEEGYSVEDTFLIDEMLLKTSEGNRGPHRNFAVNTHGEKIPDA